MKNAPMHILLADDDMDDCDLFTDVLEELSINTGLSMVHDGEQLMKHLNAQTNVVPDVIFLDLNMPRKNGFECLLEIKQKEDLKDIPVIVISTSYNQAIISQLFEKNARNYIRKPSDFDDLKNVIQNALLSVQQKVQATTLEQFILQP